MGSIRLVPRHARIEERVTLRLRDGRLYTATHAVGFRSDGKRTNGTPVEAHWVIYHYEGNAPVVHQFTGRNIRDVEDWMEVGRRGVRKPVDQHSTQQAAA